jgi:hypothetical protein
MNIRRLIWFPAVREHSLVLGVALIAVPILGLFAVPKFPAFKEFEAIQGSVSLFLFWSALLAPFNFAIFFANARGDYLTLRGGILKIAASFVVLSFLLTAGWATFRILVKGAPPPDLPALFGGSVKEWTRFVRTIFVGQGGLMMVLFFSGIWKPAAADTLEVTQAWRDLRPLIERLHNGGPNPPWVAAEARELKARLDLLADNARKLQTRKLPPTDKALAANLVVHAMALRAELDIPLAGYPALATRADLEIPFRFLLTGE